MSTRIRVYLALFIILTGLSALAGCNFEPGDGTQLAGQECLDNSDCISGLVCAERRCAHQGAVNPAEDAGPSDDVDVRPPQDATDVPPMMDVPVAPDAEIVCEPGSRRCVSEGAYEICSEDGSRWFEGVCEGATVCVEGRCEFDELCEDGDGDGYGPDCQLGRDCDDTNPTINPGADERCDTPVDDNCDGNVNEECTECCPGGCGPDATCSNCQCIPNDPTQCTAQDQPCTQEGYNNGYYCTAFGSQSGRMRCLGICDRTVDNPNSTCPDPGTICSFGDDQNGVCMTGCTLSQGCGLPGQGCLPVDSQPREGICTPTNPANQVGDRCDPDTFFDCEEGAYCIDLQDGGRCVEGCRAFSSPDGTTDCSSGHCLSLQGGLGMCRPDASASPGEECSQQEVFRTCGEDATGCFPTGRFSGPQCLRFCRLDQGDADCLQGERCRQYDRQNEDTGICTSGGFGP